MTTAVALDRGRAARSAAQRAVAAGSLLLSPPIIESAINKDTQPDRVNALVEDGEDSTTGDEVR
ncbi:MAG: hypothetical protein IPK80_25810 [Nannocystis sp.]|nr:hypothetical protein [Nannocystis sp.]